LTELIAWESKCYQQKTQSGNWYLPANQNLKIKAKAFKEQGQYNKKIGAFLE
jgi:hypothetical protein